MVSGRAHRRRRRRSGLTCNGAETASPSGLSRADAEIPDGLKALDNPGKVPLACRSGHTRSHASGVRSLDRFRPRLELPVLQSFCVPTPRRGSCAPASGRERGRPNRCAPISSPQAIKCRAFADGQSGGGRQFPRPCRSRSLRPKPLSQSLDNRGVEKVERRDSSAIRLDVPNAFCPVAHIRRKSRPNQRNVLGRKMCSAGRWSTRAC
jgi:hypothetical protein